MSHLRHVASVWGDGRPGLVSAMEHLRELGHRRIGMITVTRWPDADAKKPFVQAGTHRQQHIIGSLKEAGLETRESWIAGVSKDLSEVHAAVDRVLSSRPRPTALFCQNDFMAEAIARCLRERGVVVPRDMSLVGYDDSRIAARCDPPLTTVRQPRHTVGRKCFELLDALREKGGSFDGVEERVRTSLVIRASTGQAAQEVLPG
jgi:DNA-binding LacI/PurR family transcriptional regulator